jgi:hypothetical protein
MCLQDRWKQKWSLCIEYVKIKILVRKEQVSIPIICSTPCTWNSKLALTCGSSRWCWSTGYGTFSLSVRFKLSWNSKEHKCIKDDNEQKIKIRVSSLIFFTCHNCSVLSQTCPILTIYIKHSNYILPNICTIKIYSMVDLKKQIWFCRCYIFLLTWSKLDKFDLGVRTKQMWHVKKTKGVLRTECLLEISCIYKNQYSDIMNSKERKMLTQLSTNKSRNA